MQFLDEFLRLRVYVRSGVEFLLRFGDLAQFIQVAVDRLVFAVLLD